MQEKLPYNLELLAKHINGKVLGDKHYTIIGLATLQSAKDHQLAFYANRKYKKHLSDTKAGCVLLKPSDADSFSGNKILSDNPYLDFAKLTRFFLPQSDTPASIHPSAVIASDVVIGDDVRIDANVVIDTGCVIGDKVHIYPGCYLGAKTKIGVGSVIYANTSTYHNVNIGNNCIIHSGAVIGSDGFGFAPSEQGWQKIYQLGGVEIGDSVEIGAATTIDRGAIDDTIIANGVKIDNQVQIAHNVQIGENTAIAGAVAIAGSTIIGKRCTIAGAVGIIGHLNIVDDVHVTAMSLVTKSISKAGSYSSGVPMNSTEQWRKNAARFNQLDKLAKQIHTIKK